MIDLRVIEIRDVLAVRQIESAHGVTPVSVILTGPGLKDAFEVYINEVKSPTFVEINNTQILAQVPERIVNAAIRSVVVISSKLTSTTKSKITFRISDQPSAVSGLEFLIQRFLKILLQTPGSDAFARRIGGGLLRVAGKLSSSPMAAASSVAADVQLAVNKTKRQLLMIQSGEPQLAIQEKLSSAQLLEARFAPQEQSLVVIMSLKNQNGNAAVVNMET